MIQGIQREAAAVGKDGCYMLSIFKAAELLTSKELNVLREYALAVLRGDIRTNCFVQKPDALLSELSGRKWVVSKQGLDYKTKPGEIEITRYEWAASPAGVLGHFVLTDGFGDVLFDPMGVGDDSPVVKFGVPVSKRIFTPV